MSKLIITLILLIFSVSSVSGFSLLNAKKRASTPSASFDPYGPNLVTNGGFESGDFTGWSAEGSGGTHSVDAAVFQEGAYSYKMITTSNTDGKSQSLAVTAEETYRVSGYIYVSSYTGGSAHIDLFKSLCGLDSSGINVSTANGGFVYYSENVAIPAGCSSIDVRAFADGPSTMTVYFDDIKVEKLL